MCDSAHCSIELLAYGANNDATTRYGYVKLNTDPVWQAAWFGEFPNRRGVNIILVDPFECSVTDTRQFDTFRQQTAATELSTYLKQVSRGSIIVAVTGDEPTRNLAPALQTLREMGADVADVQYRGAFGFVAQNGFPAKTVLRKALTQEQGTANQPQVGVTITGAIYCKIKHFF